MKKISIVVPVYNEDGNIQFLYDRVSKVMKKLSGKYNYELIFTDNHSDDKSPIILNNLAERDKKVRVIRFSRNFGYQNSILAGHLFSTGDAVVQLDCDLQDPPEIIPRFIEKWEQGFQVVYGIRKNRKESWFVNILRKFFYRLIDLLSEDKLPHDAGDFGLVDRRIVDELRKIYDASPYLRGLITNLGFRQTGIPYSREERKRGKTKFNIRKMIELAMDGIVSHSVVPLKIATYMGFLVMIITVLLSIHFAYQRYFGTHIWPEGFAQTTILILLGIGLNAIFLGAIGEYIARIYLQVKRKPIVVVEKMINVPRKGNL